MHETMTRADTVEAGRRDLGAGPRVGAAVRALKLITGGLIAVYLISTIFRDRPSTLTLYDGWVGNLAYLGCAAICGLRAIYVKDRQRVGWAALAASLLLFNLGNLFWTTVVQFMDPIPYPAISDWVFLLFYPVAYLAVGLLVRDALPARGSRAIWLDGMIAALGVASLLTATLIAYVWHNLPLGGDPIDVAVNVAYPIGDLILATMVVVVFAVQGWRPQRVWWTLGAGLVTFAVADWVYVLRVSSGTYETGTPLDTVWMLGTFLMALAAWQSRVAPPARSGHAPPAVIPGLFLVTSLGVVVYASWGDILALAVILATCTLLFAVARMGHAYRQLRALAESRREARTDELTGLPNRRLFYETLRNCLKPGSGREQLAVLMIDLDRFKEINDSLGHSVGDEVLRQLGPRLAGVVGGAGTVARLGGDEFGLLLAPIDNPVSATLVAERVRDVLKQRFHLESIALRVDASIGIAIAPRDGDGAEALLQKADVAMYEAKRRHRAWEFYSPSRDTHTRDQLELMEDVRDAIARQELVLHYQPKLDLATQAVAGVEALVRWQHPVRGLLSPNRFLSLFEQSGLVGHLDLAVLDQAAAQQARWRREDIDVSVAVNLSAANISDEQLPEKVAQVLDRRGVDPHGVVLEITEDCFMGDAEQSREVLGRLHELGVELAVDDYGTGFSSLAYLRDLPVDELKLDQVFVAAAAAQDQRSVAIVRSTIELAHALDLRVVAEGVETDEALRLITELGCDAAQGYLLGRPAPAAMMFPATAPRP